ncbi:MAG: RDD family protein [Psychrobium sp.]|nr:RDD family protein [Psychrobium sp.]
MDNFDVKKIALAGAGKRYQGQFLDGLFSLFLFACMMYGAKQLGLQGVMIDAAIFFVPFLYFALSDALPGGQSLGKKVLNIAVISKSTGETCQLWQSFMRNAFSPIFGIIDAVLIIGKKRQRLGDMFANTIVVKKAA